MWLPAQAVEVSGLYEAELSVTSQGRAERKEVIRAALLQVLIKVSGNTNVALSAGVPQILKRSNQFLQQYRYRNANNLANSKAGTRFNRQYLWVRFDNVSLNKAMRNIGLATWGRSRPATLAWIALERGGKRELLNSSSSLSKVILQQAKRRGIPLGLPRLDLEDQRKISVSDVLAGFQGPILQASQRYSSEAVLVGRLRQLANNRWQGRWTLNHAGQESNWTEEGDFDAVISFGVDGVTSSLASKYARITDNVAGELKVLVTDILTLQDYARSDQFLAGLDGVIGVEPERIETQSVIFKVKLRGDHQSLLNAIQLSSQPIFSVVDPPSLAVVNTPSTNTIATTPSLTFKLIP